MFYNEQYERTVKIRTHLTCLDRIINNMETDAIDDFPTKAENVQEIADIVLDFVK